MAEPLLRVERVEKRFGAVSALDGLSLDVAPGEFLALFGGSGSGKSTLLRLVAGFEAPDAGRILLRGRDIAGLPPQARDVGMVFQSYALFPHLSVFDNVAYGLRREGVARPEIARRVEEALAMVGLQGMERRLPHQLSGGQRQRVALVRSLVKRPSLLLLDEPLGALDAGLRERTGFELRALQRRTGAGFVMVTHDQAEALSLADPWRCWKAGGWSSATRRRSCTTARPRASSRSSSAARTCWKGARGRTARWSAPPPAACCACPPGRRGRRRAQR